MLSNRAITARWVIDSKKHRRRKATGELWIKKRP